MRIRIKTCRRSTAAPWGTLISFLTFVWGACPHIHAQISTSDGGSDHKRIVETVWSTWEKRQDAVRSLYVEFSAEKYSVDMSIEDDGRKKELLSKQPAIKFWLSGSRTRVEKLIPYVSKEREEIPLIRFMETCNGKEGRYFSATKGVNEHKQYHHGTVWNATQSEPELFTAYVLNIIRPIGHHGLVNSRNNLSIFSDEKSTEQDVVTLVVDPENGWSYRVICDAKNYMPIGIKEFHGTTLRSKTEYEYAPNEDFLVPFPVSWSHSNIKEDGELINHFDCVRKRIEFNRDYPDSLFLLEFPPETKIHDTRSGEEKVLIVDKEGSWVPRAQLTSQASNRYRYLMIGLLAVLAIVVLLGYWFYQSRRKVIHHDSS